MAHKNDYACVVFFPDEKPKKWKYVHKLKGFASFLNDKHKNWSYFNVYDRKTNGYLKRFYKNNLILIPDFITLLAIVFAPYFFFLTFSNRPLITFINGIYNTVTIPNLSIIKNIYYAC